MKPVGANVHSPRVLDNARRSGIPAAALERARFNVEHCAAAADNGRARSLRRCLQGFNDDIMEYLNVDLENALKNRQLVYRF